MKKSYQWVLLGVAIGAALAWFWNKSTQSNSFLAARGVVDLPEVPGYGIAIGRG